MLSNTFLSAIKRSRIIRFFSFAKNSSKIALIGRTDISCDLVPNMIIVESTFNKGLVMDSSAIKEQLFISESKFITAKAFSEQFGILNRDVLSAINRQKLEKTRNEEGVFVYEVDDLLSACEEFYEESKRKIIDLELEVLKRFIPEIQKVVTEIVRSELSLSISIRDTKEARLIDTLASIRSLMIENRTVLGFLSKMTAQIDLATTNKIANQQPSVFKHSESIKKEEKEISEEDKPKKDASFFEYKTNGTNPQKGKELVNVFLVGPRLVEPSKKILTENIKSFYSVLISKEKSLSSTIKENIKLINEFIEPYEDVVSDCPEVSDFYSMSSKISSWVSKHSNEAPRIVLFLALNRTNNGIVTAQDYLDFLAS